MARSNKVRTANRASYRLGTATHVGGRESNEDACASVDTPHGVVVVVADGAGGHSGGEVASDITARESVRYFQEHPSEPPGAAPIEAAMRLAQASLRAAITATPRHRDMRSTILVVQATRERVWVGHVGDSRAYLIRDGAARLLTRDDTLVQSLVDVGEIDSEAAKRHSKAHVLLQCLGEPRELDYHVTDAIETHPGDVLVACSDGLSEVVPDAQIAQLASEGTGREVAAKLLAEAVTRGSSDNITVAVISWHPSQSRPTVALQGRVVSGRAARKRRPPYALAAIAVMVALSLAVLGKMRRNRAAAQARLAAASRTHAASRAPAPPPPPPAPAAPAAPVAAADPEAVDASVVAAATADADAAASLPAPDAPDAHLAAPAPATAGQDAAPEQEAFATVRLRALPHGARVFVDRTARTVGADHTIPVPAGRRVRLRIRMEGFREQREALLLQPGETLQIRVSLHPEEPAASAPAGDPAPAPAPAPAP